MSFPFSKQKRRLKLGQNKKTRRFQLPLKKEQLVALLVFLWLLISILFLKIVLPSAF